MTAAFPSKAQLLMLLTAMNIVAHFLPFERSALAPDSYAALVRVQNLSTADWLSHALRWPDRPLNHLALLLQSKLAGDDPRLGFLLILSSSTVVLLAVFLVLRELLHQETSAFVGSLLFCLMPMTLETHHSTIFVNINAVFAVYLFSFLAFLRFAKGGSVGWLVGALLGYTIGIFWYEVGFLLPLVIIAYSRLFKPDKMISAWYFLLPALGYAVFRLTGSFGLGDLQNISHHLSISAIPANLLEVGHHYAGRYLMRTVLYGGYKFLSIELPWLVIILLADLVLVFLIAWWLRRQMLSPVERRVMLLAGVLWAAFVAPILLNNIVGVGARHLVLPALGVILILLQLLATTKRYWRPVLVTGMVILLVISQGTAWIHVVACRINGAVYATLKEKRAELLMMDTVIIDTKSFADQIPFTWVHRDFNVLNTYYGAQAFEDWGLQSMVRLVTGATGPMVYIASESPRLTEGDSFEFAVSEPEAYRSVSRQLHTVPQAGTVIIDFQDVFGHDFQNGLRSQDGYQRELTWR